MSNVVPDGWSHSKISEIGNVVTGSTPSTTESSYWGGDIPFVSPADFDGTVYVRQTGRTVTERGAQKGRILPKDSILVTCIGSLGGIAISSEISVTNQQINAIVPSNANDNRFIYYNVLFHIDELEKNAGTTTLPIINKSTFGGITLPIPPLPEQKKIASILTSVDEVIENTQKQIDKLQDLKKATMNELLTKGIGHTEFKDSELGRIPKSWEVAFVGDLADFQNGNGFKAQDWSNKGLPIIRIQNLNGGEDFNYYEGKVDSRWYVPNGSLLFAWSGQRGKSFGARFWNGQDGVLNQHIFKVSENINLVTKQFLHLLLQHITVEIESDAHGFKDSFMHVTKGDVTARKTVLPSHQEQIQIVTVYDAIERQLKLKMDKLHQTQSLKKSLMQDLLTGKVRVAVN